jgi:hypothetical protein
MKFLLIFSYVIKHIITEKNKVLHKLFYSLFAPYNRKVKIFVSEFNIYYLRRYIINLKVCLL